MRDRSLKLIRVSSMVFMAAVCATDTLAQTPTTYGGEATALSGTVAGVPVNLAATGPLEPSGGARNNSLVCYPGGPQCYVGVPDATSGLLSVQGLSAATVGQGPQTYSHASVANFTMLVSGVEIKAHYIEGAVKAKCDGTGDPPASESVGRSQFSQLTIAGVPVNVSGLPNQTVTVASPLGNTVTIVLNEQKVSNGYLTVRALHAVAPPIVGVVEGTDVTVGKVEGKVNCGNVDRCLNTKITSGGFVIVNGDKITFAASGRNESTWGHFIAINHGTKDKLQAVTQFTVIAPDGTALIEGFARINGDAGGHFFTARLKDNGEPGQHVDEFNLEVPDHAESFTVLPPENTTIDGGNIQFHGPPKSCDGGTPPPEE